MLIHPFTAASQQIWKHETRFLADTSLLSRTIAVPRISYSGLGSVQSAGICQLLLSLRSFVPPKARIERLEMVGVLYVSAATFSISLPAICPRGLTGESGRGLPPYSVMRMILPFEEDCMFGG